MLDARRASALALVLLAVVAIPLVLRTLDGRTPRPRPQVTATVSPAPPPAENPASAPPTAGPSSHDGDLDLSGIVVDPDGTPVVGATVQSVFHPPRTDAPREASPWIVLGPATRSGVGGTFAVRLLRGQSAGLRVTAAGFAPYECGPALAGDHLRVVVRPAVSCVVTLRDASDRPVVGRPVLVEHRKFPAEVLLHREALSDAEGRARFDDLPGGLAVTAIAAPERQLPGEAAHVVLPPRGTFGVELTVAAGRTLSGRVTDVRTGLPIPGARVQRTVWPGGTATTTDADGRYLLQGVPESAQGGSDDDPPSAAPTICVTADGRVAATAVAPAGSVLDVPLESAETLTGRAVDGDGRPIAGAWVFLAQEPVRNADPEAFPNWEFTPATMTGADGRFRVATEARYRGVRVEAVGFAPVDRRMAWKRSPQGPTDVGDLVLRAGLMLEGQVFDGDGSPMRGVRVHLDDGTTCTSDDLGRYCMRDLAAARRRIRAYAKGRDQLDRGVTLSPDRDPTRFDLAFPAGRAVTIEVRDASGAPVVGATLDVVERRIWAQTDAQGRGVVVLPPGPWKARVAAGSRQHEDGRAVFVAREAAIPADATHVVVTLDRTLPPEEMLPIAGAVVDEEGRPADGVLLTVTWEGLGGESQRAVGAQSREDGGFAVRVPRSAVCDIRADARVRKGGPPMKGSAHDAWDGESKGVRAGRTDVVVVVRPAPRDRTVTVLVLSPDGVPQEGASVVLSGNLLERVRAVTGKDGRAGFSRLVHRSCSASADPPEHRRAECLPGHSPPLLPAGQEITLRLPRAAEFAGAVLLPDGSPARGAYVTFTAGSTRQDEWVDASGRFRMRVDADLPLPWRLTAALGQDWPPTQVWVDLSAPPSADVTLRLADPMRR